MESFSLTVPGVLNGTVFPEDNAEDLVDWVLTVDHEDATSSGCNFGMNFKTGY